MEAISFGCRMITAGGASCRNVNGTLDGALDGKVDEVDGTVDDTVDEVDGSNGSVILHARMRSA